MFVEFGAEAFLHDLHLIFTVTRCCAESRGAGMAAVRALVQGAAAVAAADWRKRSWRTRFRRKSDWLFRSME